jgi:hypothetical protein
MQMGVELLAVITAPPAADQVQLDLLQVLR